MFRRALTVSALALATFGVSAPLAQAAPAPLVLEHLQGKFTGTKDTVCRPIIGCTYTVDGIMATQGGAEDCYVIQHTSNGTSWGTFPFSPACGTTEEPQARGIPWPSRRPQALRLCKVTPDNITVLSCGAQQAA